MYRNRRIATNSSTFRDIHWLNFSWCEALNPSLNKFVLVHHPNKVWMRDMHCSLKSWRKVKIWKERAGDISLEQLYLEPLVPSAQKVCDLKQMACTHVPLPQRNFYVNFANFYNCSDTDNQDSKTDSDWFSSKNGFFVLRRNFLLAANIVRYFGGPF